MRFYGIQPSEAARLDQTTIETLLHHAQMIRARERIERVFDFGLAFWGSKGDAKESLVELAQEAFKYDPRTRAVVIESIMRVDHGS